jgi:hypothetical protein
MEPKMPANTARDTGRLARKSPTKGVFSRPSKLHLVGLSDLDGRTSATKRARALAAALTEELGGHTLTPTQDAAVERAATLVALAEDLRTRRLAGDMTVSLEDMTRVDSAADRAMRRLGIKPKSKSNTSFDEHVAKLVAAQAPAEDEEAEAS